MSDLTRIILIIVTLLLSAFFAMSESSFSYCNQIRLRVLADDGKKSAKLVLKLIDKFDKYITTVLICTNIVHILNSVVFTLLFVSLFTKKGIVNPEQTGAIVSTIVTTLTVFFIAETLPKVIAKAKANKCAMICAYPMAVLDFILTPISLVFLGLIKVVKIIFKTKDDEPLLDEEDFQNIVDSIEAKGTIEENESDIIQAAVDFDDTKVKEVMCPREEINALDINQKMTKDELIDYIIDNPYTRIPVYDGDIDHILGILHTQRLLKVLMKRDTYDIKKLLIEPIIVKPNVHLDTLVEEFKRKRTHMALVVDKDSHTLGLITMEDALEELVGDIDESNEGGVKDE